MKRLLQTNNRLPEINSDNSCMGPVLCSVMQDAVFERSQTVLEVRQGHAAHVVRDSDLRGQCRC